MTVGNDTAIMLTGQNGKDVSYFLSCLDTAVEVEQYRSEHQGKAEDDMAYIGFAPCADGPQHITIGDVQKVTVVCVRGK